MAEKKKGFRRETKVKCEMCGKRFNQKNPQQRYCSKRCWQERWGLDEQIQSKA